MRLPLQTHHLFHGGMYSRTIRLESGQVMTGAVLKVATLLIIKGDAQLVTESGSVFVDGYDVLPGSAGRQTVCIALTDVVMTMIYPTRETTVDAAEREFTDDWKMLLSRDSTDDTLIVTGE